MAGVKYLAYYNQGDAQPKRSLGANQGLLTVALPSGRMFSNYDHIQAATKRIEAGSLGRHSKQYALDSALAPSHAPLMTLKTLTTDWKSKRQKPTPLDNYFARTMYDWDMFNWDGMFMRTLEPRAFSQSGPAKPKDHIEFQPARDAQGHIYLPEILAVRYSEGDGVTSDCHCFLGPMWRDSVTDAYGYNMFNSAGGTDNRPVDLQFQGRFGLFAHGWIDAGGAGISPIIDLRDNSGRGVFWPLRDLVMYCDYTAQPVQTEVLYRYAPVEFGAINILYEKFRSMNDSAVTGALPTSGNYVQLNRLDQIDVFIAWYNTYNASRSIGTDPAKQSQLVIRDKFS